MKNKNAIEGAVAVNIALPSKISIRTNKMIDNDKITTEGLKRKIKFFFVSVGVCAEFMTLVF